MMHIESENAGAMKGGDSMPDDGLSELTWITLTKEKHSTRKESP